MHPFSPETHLQEQEKQKTNKNTCSHLILYLATTKFQMKS